MGGNRSWSASNALTRARLALIGGAIAVTATACNSDSPTTSTEVGAADAYTALIDWQVSEQAPVANDQGQIQLPVIFIVADDDNTISIGVQADVAAATVDVAAVRFADDITETFDAGVAGEPVRDSGVLLLVGDMPDPAPSIDVDVLRYHTIDDSEPLRLVIAADDGTTNTHNIATQRATVTSVTRP